MTCRTAARRPPTSQLHRLRQIAQALRPAACRTVQPCAPDQRLAVRAGAAPAAPPSGDRVDGLQPHARDGGAIRQHPASARLKGRPLRALQHLVEVRRVESPVDELGLREQPREERQRGPDARRRGTRRARGACARWRAADPRPTRPASRSSGRRRSARRGPRSAPLSSRMPGPPARRSCRMRPGDGRKPLSGSSA